MQHIKPSVLSAHVSIDVSIVVVAGLLLRLPLLLASSMTSVPITVTIIVPKSTCCIGSLPVNLDRSYYSYPPLSRTVECSILPCARAVKQQPCC